MSYYVFILQCADGSYYTGLTTNLSDAVNRHIDGRGSTYTACRQPLELIFSESYTTRAHASRAYAAIRNMSRFEKNSMLHRLEFADRAER